MSPGAPPAAGRLAVSGRIGVLVSLALAFVVAGAGTVPVESAFFDLLQRLAAAPARAPVVLVTTPEDPWRDPRLPELIARIRAAGAMDLVIPAPAPAATAEAEQSRLAALLTQEQRAAANPGAIARLIEQRDQVAQRLARQEAAAAAMDSAGNVIIVIDTANARPVAMASDGTCAAAIGASGAAAPGASARSDARRRSPRLPGDSLCGAAAGIGHVEFTADSDGVTRLLPGAVPTLLGALPSAAALAATRTGAGFPQPAAGELLLRHYAPSLSAGAFPDVDARDLLLGVDTGRLKDQLVVLAPPGVLTHRTALASDASTALLVATGTANLLADESILRPAGSAWLELAAALGLGLLLALYGSRLPLGTAALGALLCALVLVTVEAAAFAAGLWLKLGSLALFCLTGTAIAQALRHLPARGALAGSALRDKGGDAEPGGPAELDLAFSVLRQQPTTNETKARLYELAMEHGRRRDYARAERVFRHLSARDPGYRDVATKLEKLSGARLGQLAGAAAGIPPGRAAAAATPAAAAGPAATSPARSLGRYVLDRVIGRGAMATVYLGRDPTINRLVAIKTVPLAEEFEEGDLATARGNFLREAESAGRLNHPNIIGIYDAGEDQHVAYLAMEYFEGKPLSYYAQVGRLLPPAKVFELMAQAAEALHYAHSQNVVHRDVKPANILYDDVSDTLKLVDFGIARLTDSSRTRTGIILGTPSYMSPEQLAASRVSGQSDLYSLAVTMYHLLAGSPPFQADSIPKLMERIANHAHRPLRDLRDDIPACADDLLTRALAKNPADRFADGRAMAAALRECCNSLATEPA